MNTHIKATIANIFMLDQLKKAFGSMLVVKENELWMCSLQLKQNIKISVGVLDNFFIVFWVSSKIDWDAKMFGNVIYSKNARVT